MNTKIDNKEYHTVELDNYNVTTDLKGIAIDIGSAIGKFIEKYHDKFKEVYAFEPVLTNFEENYLNHHDKDNVFLYPLALGKGSVLEMKSSGKNKYNYVSNLDEELEKMVEGKEIQRAPSITISEILDLIGEKVTYLKCDSEGGELALIDDRIGEIDYLGIEIHSWILSKEKLSELEAHLSKWFNINKVSTRMWECKNKRL